MTINCVTVRVYLRKITLSIKLEHPNNKSVISAGIFKLVKKIYGIHQLVNLKLWSILLTFTR